MGKRVDWGVRESWEGNYLASTKENPEASHFQSALRNMRNKDGFREVSTVKCVIMYFNVIIHKNKLAEMRQY